MREQAERYGATILADRIETIDGKADAFEAQGSTVTIAARAVTVDRSEEHTSELQSLMRISYAVFCLKKKKYNKKHIIHNRTQKNLVTHLNHTTIKSTRE